MNAITYQDFFDKVYGCWLGKAISGNIGAPYEGMKQKLNLSYDPAFMEKMLPNDDLDLQVLWLEVCEKYGPYFTSEDLAESFEKNCPYAPGEYAFFKKNYRKGIHPPECGRFNNAFYHDGMGSPIRSEIWAVLAAGNAELAAQFAEKDAVLDHYGDSVYGEQFLAALEAAAFFESDIRRLIERGKEFVPQESRLYRLICDVCRWSEEIGDADMVRGMILKHYGHPEATNLYQNIGFTLLSLLLSDSFLDVTMLACNCGFDTDCTCATAGAILGIVYGAKRILAEGNFGELTYALGVKANRRSDLIRDLAEDTARLACAFARTVNKEITIEGTPENLSAFSPREEDVTVSVCYEGEPAVGIGERTKIFVRFENRTGKAVRLQCAFRAETLDVCAEREELLLAPGQAESIALLVSAEGRERLPEKNLIVAECRGDVNLRYTFGLSGSRRWLVYGPYWKNKTQVPDLRPGQSYWDYFPSASEDEMMDKIRFYHMNCQPAADSLREEDIRACRVPVKGAEDIPERINIATDAFCLEDIVSFGGPACYYFHTRFYSEEERVCGIQVGHTDAFRLWLNGELVCESAEREMLTPENIHKLKNTIKKGENDLVVELFGYGGQTKFSYNFLEKGVCNDHWINFETVEIK